MESFDAKARRSQSFAKGRRDVFEGLTLCGNRYGRQESRKSKQDMFNFFLHSWIP
jgi:hypothetical protein